MSTANDISRNGTIMSLIIIICLFLSPFTHLWPVSEKRKLQTSSLTPSSPPPVFPAFLTRDDNTLIEDFSTLDHVDLSNTTVIVDTINRQALLRGQGTPKSNIRQVTNPDHQVRHNGFNAMAVDEQGRYYHLDAGSGTTVEIFQDWTDYFQGRPRIDTLTVPESQHSTQMFVANGHLYTSSESGNNLRKVRLGDKATVQSNINHARTSNWGWRGPQQQGVACDGVYIYTWCDTTLKVWDLNENLLRTVNGLPNKGGYGTCFAVGHYFYCVDYSQAAITHRVDGDTGQVQAYTNEVFITNNYVVDASYDYFHNRLFTGRGWQDTYALDNVAQVWGNLEGFTNGTIQSNVLVETLHTIGSVKAEYFEDTPQDTRIVYNITVDGKNWERLCNATEMIFTHKGAALKWNASLYTNDSAVSPSIKSISFRWNFVDAPELTGPGEEDWIGDSTPDLDWDFRDPDMGDAQSNYLVEIYRDPGLTDLAYNSSWINSSETNHTPAEPLEDGTFYWKVRTKDSHLAPGNYSEARKIMIDVTRPVGNITIEKGALTVNEQLVTVRIYAADNGSGVTDMQIISDSGADGPWETFETEKGIALSTADGLKTIGVRFRDNASIVSDVFNDSVYLDLNPPGDINISSPTHPDPDRFYNITEPVFRWEAPFEISGIKGFSYIVDSSHTTMPAKILYGENGELRETYPGELPVLSDGTWYFHIVSCDIYDQWGNTTHFRFNTDTVNPLISELFPADDQWFNTTAVRVSALFSDLEGAGLDVSSIEYSYRTDEGTYSPWTAENIVIEVIERGAGEDPVKIRAEVEITFSEGKDNTVRWRVSDLATNGPVLSKECRVMVDGTPVFFSDPIPSPDDGEIFVEEDIVVGITIEDGGGSGVDGRTVEYCISYWGADEEFFVNWTPVNNRMVKDPIEITMELAFEPGRNNFIRWRAGDIVGNYLAVSDPVRVWLNSPPVPMIMQPQEGDVYKKGESIFLNGTESNDIEGDELFLYWVIRNKTLGTEFFSGSGDSLTAILDVSGDYTVILNADDHFGFNVSTEVDIFVSDEKAPAPGDPGTPEEKSEEKGEKGEGWLLIFGIAAIVVLIIVLLLFILIRKKKRKEDERVPPSAQMPIPPSPYPAGYMGVGVGNYVPPPGSQVQDRYGGYGGAFPAAMPPQYAADPRLALPPGPIPPQAQYHEGMHQQPALVAPGLAGTGGTTYTLPAFSTDQGAQDLNLLALPEADNTADTSVLDLSDLIGPTDLIGSTDLIGLPLTNMPELDLGASATPVPPPTVPQAQQTLPSPDEPPGAPLPPLPVDAARPDPTGIEPAAPGVPDALPPPESAPPNAQQQGGDFTPPTPDVAPSPGTMMQCHACGNNHTVEISKFPAIVTCPVCQTQGMINSL